MFFSIFRYLSLAIFVAGFVYRIFTWFSKKTTVESKDIPTSARISKGLKGILSTLLSRKILTLIKVFFLDVVIQRKVFREDFFRWLTHILIYAAFMLLFVFHALQKYTLLAINEDFTATVMPFSFLRNLFGLLLIVGIGMAMYRRIVLRAPRLKTNAMDKYAVLILALVMISGFLLKGVKIGSHASFTVMVEDYADIDEEEEIKAMLTYWVKEFSVVAPDMEGPFEEEVLEEGQGYHEDSCESCHSKPQWAFVGFAVAKTVKGAALGLDKAGAPAILLYIHFLACFIGLAYLPFSKFLHIFSSPLSLLANSVMDKKESDPANIATRQALELDACMHCGACTSRCSVGITYELLQNENILPSEKLQSLKKIASGKEMSEEEFKVILNGTYLCTNCHRCTDVCPAGINLEDLWFNLREHMFQKDRPLVSALSPLSFFRGLSRESLPPGEYQKPLLKAREAIAAECDLMKSRDQAVTLAPGQEEFQGILLESAQAGTFSACFGCQTCTNACPVVANYENPLDVLGLVPHQIMYAAGLGIKDLALGSNMLWDCVTCYQCQEQCPQGVKVTEVLYELKNLAAQNGAKREKP